MLLAYNWDRKNCLVYGVAECPLFRGCLSIEVNGKTIGTFRIVCYIMSVYLSGVSFKRGSTVMPPDNRKKIWFLYINTKAYSTLMKVQLVIIMPPGNRKKIFRVLDFSVAE